MYDLIVKGGKLIDREGIYDIAVMNGKIVKIDKTVNEEAKEIINANGLLVIPPFVQSHVHFDSTLTAGEPRFNESGTLFEGIEIWSERRKTMTREDIKNRAIKCIKWHVAQGILNIRSHVDICDPNLTAVKAMLEVKEELSDYINLQLVAFPQEGIVSYEGGEELMEEALKLGVDVVGGAPHLEFTREDGVESVNKIFKLANKYGSMVDIHCDEIDDEQSRFIEVAIANSIRYDIGDRVSLSHTTAMHSYNNAYASKILNLSKRAGVNYISNPLSNISLQGRLDNYPKRRGITRVKEISEMGINISLGHDNILDPFYGLGIGSMLQVANMCIHVCQLTGIDEIKRVFKMITLNGAKTLKIKDYGIEVGNSGDIVILDASDEIDAIRRLSVAKTVIKDGRIISQTEPAKTVVIIEGKNENIDYRK